MEKKQEEGMQRRKRETNHPERRRGRNENLDKIETNERSGRAAQVCLRRLKVLMLNHNMIGNGMEFLLGKPSTCVQMN